MFVSLMADQAAFHCAGTEAEVIANRELGMEDYLAIARRHINSVLIWAVVATLVGFLISYALAPKYTSQSVLVVEPQEVPAGYVKPIVTDPVSDRIEILQQNVLSRTRLLGMVNRLGLLKSGENPDALIDAIRSNLDVEAMDPSAPRPGSSPSPSPSAKNSAPKKTPTPRPGATDDVPGFYVDFTYKDRRKAQQICAELVSMLLQENLKFREQAARSTTELLSHQLEQAKQNLDDLDNKLSAFKAAHLGQLPTDEDKNLKILAGLSSQLDATTQAINRAQQDKSFAESLLTQELTSWQSIQASPELPSLRQQLAALQSQLILLQGRYKEDYPDVVKTKRDVAELRARLKEMNADDQKGLGDDTATKLEPPDILHLRQQIHQNEVVIEQATREQHRVQGLINQYQSKLTLSPSVEEEYKELTRDNETAHKIYDDLLTNKNAAEMQTEMESKQQGEQIKLLNPASLPDSPSFPVRWMFAAGGFGAGSCIGLALAFWMELKDKAIRNEGDLLAALEMPMLVAVPWTGTSDNSSNKSTWNRIKPFKSERAADV